MDVTSHGYLWCLGDNSAVNLITQPMKSGHEAPAPEAVIKTGGRQDAQKRVFIGYAGKDFNFVELLKNKLEPYVGSVWVDWENVVLFEDNLASQPDYVDRIKGELQDAALIIFVVSKNWVGKKFPMLELEWALNLTDRGTRVLPVLLDWSLTDAKKRIRPDITADRIPAGCARLLNELFTLTVLNTDSSYRSWDKLTTRVAGEVLKRPGIAPQTAPANWVGRKADVDAIRAELGISGSGEPRGLDQEGCVVAVEGMSGVGKSALMAHLYDVAVPKYVAAGRKVVLVEVGHNASDTKIKDVQKQILKGLGFSFDNMEDLKPMLSQALRRSGYALFLGDVWHDTDMWHLEAIFGRDWDGLLYKELGKGSIVVLAGQALPKQSWPMYDLQPFDDDSSNKLFCRHTFDQDNPPDDCSLPWKEVVNACAGLPLALRAVGGALHKVTYIKNWEEVLKELNSARDEVGKKLRVAYRLLGDEHKHAFVDIAMHWHGKECEMVDAALGPGLLAELLRRNLVDKARRETYMPRGMVEVVDMHDLLKGVGKAEADKSWLLDPTPEEVKDCRPRGLTLTKDAEEEEFKEGLLELQVLTVKDGFPAKIRLHRCRGLRWLWWSGCPDTSMDLSRAASMVWLDLHDSALTTITFKRARSSLKRMSLSGCTRLTRLEGLMGLTNLDRLILRGCKSLTSESLSSLWRLINLKELDLSGCPSLESLPSDLSELTNLRTLIVKECTNLSLSGLVGLPNLKELDLSNCTEMTSLSELSALTSLQRLVLRGCMCLRSLPDLPTLTNLEHLDVGNCVHLTGLPGPLKLANLGTLILKGCTSLTDLSDLSALQDLKYLDVRGCTSLTSLLRLSAVNLEYLNLEGCMSLTGLCLEGCTSRTNLPELSMLTNLEFLDLRDCTSLTSLPGLSAPTKLKELNLQGCGSLTDLPRLSALTDLQRLELRGCRSLTSLPDLSKLTKLKELNLQGCTCRTSLPELSTLTNLEVLDLSECTSLTSLPDLSKLTKLKELNLQGCTCRTSLPELSTLTNLEVLDLSECTSLTSLPDLSKLTKLKELNLQGCGSLASLPGLSALTGLRKLNLRGCRSLPDLLALAKLKGLNLQGCGSLEPAWAEIASFLTSLPKLSALPKLNLQGRGSCTIMSSMSLELTRTKIVSFLHPYDILRLAAVCSKLHDTLREKGFLLAAVCFKLRDTLREKGFLGDSKEPRRVAELFAAVCFKLRDTLREKGFLGDSEEPRCEAELILAACFVSAGESLPRRVFLGATSQDVGLSDESEQGPSCRHRTTWVS